MRQRRLALRHIRQRGLDLGLGHRGLRLRRLQGLHRRIDQGARAIRLALRNELLFHQNLLAFQIAARFVQIDLGTRHLGPARGSCGLRRQHRGARGVHIGLRRTNPVFEGFGVDLGDQLPRFHLGVEVHQQITYLPGHLGAHRHLRHRIDSPTGRHGGRQGTALDLRGAVLNGVGLGALAPLPPSTADRQRHHQQRCPQ